MHKIAAYSRSAPFVIHYRALLSQDIISCVHIRRDLERNAVVLITVIKVDEIDVANDFLRNAKSRGGRRFERTRYIAKAVGVGLAGVDCDVTTEPLHERVPGVPLAPNWNWSLHWINSLRDYRHNFTSSISPRPGSPVPSHPLSSPWGRPQSLSPGDSSGGRTNKRSPITLTRLLWKSACCED